MCYKKIFQKGGLHIYTIRGKILEAENFREFGEWQAIRQNFPYQYL